MDIGQLVSTELLRFPPGSALKGHDPETRFRQHLGRGGPGRARADDADIHSIRFALRHGQLALSPLAPMVSAKYGSVL